MLIIILIILVTSSSSSLSQSGITGLSGGGEQRSQIAIHGGGHGPGASDRGDYNVEDDEDEDDDDGDGDNGEDDFNCQGMKTRVVEPRTRRRSFLPWAARREARGGRVLSR